MSTSVQSPDLKTGLETLHARAEAWECDFNGHWNTRFYCKAFQTAAEVAAMLGGDTAHEVAGNAPRVLRFHAEMHSGDPITIRSFRLMDGNGQAAIAHYMMRYEKVVATAIDYGTPQNQSLPALPLEQAGLAAPRGLRGAVTPAWVPDATKDLIYQLGPMRQEELQDGGAMRFWETVARMSHASHHHDLGMGFTLERMKEEGIGRMLAEMRFTPLGACERGDFLRCASRLVAASGKAFTAAHMLYTHRGTPVAMFELCTLAVNMNTRRAMDLPDFVLERPIG